MQTVEYRFDPETGAASFVRESRFLIRAGDHEQYILGQRFAEQCNRMGWPVTFPSAESGEPRPIIDFYVSVSGMVEYMIMGIEQFPLDPPTDNEPEDPAGQPEDPESEG